MPVPARPPAPILMYIAGGADTLRIPMRAVVLHLAALAGAAHLETPLSAETVGLSREERVVEHDVEGRTPTDIRRSLSYQRAEPPLSAEAYDAYTAWHVTWNYETSPVNNLCSIGRVRVHLVITTHLPRVLPH